MRRTIIGLVIGAGLALAGVKVVDYYNDIGVLAENADRIASLAALTAAPANEWLEIKDFKVSNAIAGISEPVVSFHYDVKRELDLRGTIQSRNTDTGDVLCSGGTVRIGYPIGEYDFSGAVSRLAGVKGCSWPDGDFKIRITFFAKDLPSQIEKQFAIESDIFRVTAVSSWLPSHSPCVIPGDRPLGSGTCPGMAVP